MVYETEKGLREYGDKLDADTRAKVESAMARVREALKTNRMDEIKSATEALTSVWHEAAGKMYQHAGADTQGQRTTADSGRSEGRKSGEGEPVDADYEVVK
jgi:molecular chaperone DnaK